MKPASLAYMICDLLMSAFVISTSSVLRALEFGGRRLLARGQQFLEVAARFVGVFHQTVGHHRIRMADEVVRGVGEVAHVAILDDDALSVAKVGDVGFYVLG